jgi:hypothetical protein
MYVEPGAVLGPLRRGSDRVGAILAVGSTRDEATDRAALAAGRIRLESAIAATV